MPSRPAPTWIVRRNGQIDPSLQVLRIDESADGQHCDRAEVMVDPARAPRLQDFDPLTALGDVIEIESARLSAGALYKVRHFGTVTQHLPHISPAGETIKYVSRVEPYHFGRPAGGVLMYAPGVPQFRAPGWLEQPQGQFKLVDDEIIFNPEIDGRIVGNMHSQVRYGPARMPVFLDPESVRTEAGRTLHGGEAIIWTLSAAVYYLCWALNGEQIVVTNPTREELASVFRDSVDFVRNAKVDDGEFLPQVLDKLLKPLGYHWRLFKPAPQERKLVFFRRGTGGRVVWLKHQRHGESLDSEKTNTEAAGVVFDASRLANAIIGRGSKLQIEITAELVRAWPESLDDRDRDELTNKAIEEDAGETEGLKFAWRKWALNEAGDYIGTRGLVSIFSGALREQLRSAGLLDWMVPRRRKLLPTLTRNAAGDGPVGRNRGIEIEFGSGGNWQPADNWGIELLEHEAGILITSDDIPEALFDLGDAARVRITATIETDFRITATASRKPDSVIGFDAAAQLDLSGDFHWLVVTPFSKHFDGENPSLTVDDRVDLQNFVESLRAKFDQVDVTGNVVLDGVDRGQYAVGDRVAGIQGRNYRFNASRRGDVYPQIVGITYDVMHQRTILHLERLREFFAG